MEPSVPRTRPAESYRCTRTLAGNTAGSVITAVTVTGVPTPTGTEVGASSTGPTVWAWSSVVAAHRATTVNRAARRE